MIPAEYRKGGAKGAPAEKPNVSLEDALAVLEEHASSPRAQAALKTIRSDMEDGGTGQPARKPGSTADAKQEALARLKGTSE